VDFNEKYKNDTKLVRNPNRYYKDKGWRSWFDFLGKEKRKNPYKTYQEAKEVVKKLGIKTQTEYHKRYQEDPKLRYKPEVTYKNKGWVSWYDYLGLIRPYKTYKEAKEAVRKLKIKSNKEYRKRYKIDPRLPSTPSKTYENKGWVNWYDFLGKKNRKKTK
jgi:hypothetical protein